MLYKHHGEPEIEYPRARTKIKTISSHLKFNKRNRYLINEKLLFPFGRRRNDVYKFIMRQRCKEKQDNLL